MQIHELNNYVGSLGDSAYLPVDNGQDTGKLAYSDLFSTGERTRLWSGTAKNLNTEINFSQSGNDFEYVEIFYSAGGSVQGSVIIKTPIKDTLKLSAVQEAAVGGTQPFFYSYQTTLTCPGSGDKLTISDVLTYVLEDTTPTASIEALANITIYRVDGINTAARNKSVVEVKQVTLAAANWSDDEQTVTVADVLTSNSVIISPDPTSSADYTSAGIICTAQANNSLTFNCTTTPSSDIVVNVAVIG